MATDTLEIFGTEYTGVIGVKATDSNNQTKTYIRPQGSQTITTNDTYDVTALESVVVSVSGGGGLEYETGTWIPAEDVANYTIPFNNVHSVAPFIYAVFDSTETNSSTTADNMAITYVNAGQLFGTYGRFGDSAVLYGLACSRYKTGNGAGNGVSFPISIPYTDQQDNTNTCSRYWATESGIKFYTNSSSRYARAGRTYKWIAIWAPTS